MDDALLDLLEIRVLAVLAEKEALTPDHYPVSLNALTNGCNQLSSRDPVMALNESEVHDTLHRLLQKKLVAEVSQAGARVSKYEHRMRLKWTLEPDRMTVLTILMLRGHQTVGEIRARSERMYAFSSIGQVEQSLQFLIDKYPPLVARLPRVAGSKEARYAQLLAGAPTIAQPDNLVRPSAESPTELRVDRLTLLEEEVSRLRGEIAVMQATIESLLQHLTQDNASATKGDVNP